MSDSSQGPGWWIASDGKWYAPEQHPDARAEAEAEAATATDEAEAPAADEAEAPAADEAEAPAADEAEAPAADEAEAPAADEGATSDAEQESATESDEASDQDDEPTEQTEVEPTQELTSDEAPTAVEESVGEEAESKAPVYLTAATAAATKPGEREPWTPTTYIENPPEEEPVETAEPDEGMVVTATTNIVAGLIALVGAALIVIGSFLPWGEATGDFLDGTIDGFDSNGVGTLFAGVVLAGSAGLLLAGVRHVLMLVAVLGSSLVAVGLAIYSMFDITGSASDKLVDEVAAVTGLDVGEVAAAGTGLDVSYGLWLVLAGGAIGLISAVFVRFNE